MERSTDGPAPAGGAAQQRLAHALRGTCGAPWAGELRDLHDEARAAIADARARGETVAAASALAQLAASVGVRGDGAGALRYRNSAVTLLARAPGAPPQQRLEALLWLGVVDWSVLGDVRAARDRFARSAVLARGDELTAIALPTIALRALASAFAGDLAGAAVTAREAVEIADRTGEPSLLGIALGVQVSQLHAAGDRERTLATAERLLELREQLDPGADRELLDALAAWAVAPALLAAGDLPRGAELARAASTPERLARLHPQACSAVLAVRVRADVELGDRGGAHHHLQQLEQLGFSRTPLGSAVAGIAAAVVALADDRPLNAEVRATAAADDARRTPSRLLELRATLLAGRAQAALGAPDVAVERFLEAEGIARALGVAPAAEQAARERRALTGDAEPASAEDYGLTPRQLEIARLVAAGSTNRAVAAELGISEHTVNTHLRVAFARLGVTRRAALAAALERGSAA